MKKQIIIFYSIFFSLYGILNFYIYIRGFQGLEAHSEFKLAYTLLFCFLAASFIAGRMLERKKCTFLSRELVYIGSFWLAAMLYFFLFAALTDIVRFLMMLIWSHPNFIFKNYTNFKFLLTSVIFFVTVCILIFGWINAANLRLKKLYIKINKKAGRKNFKIAVVSDIHLGVIIGKKRLQKIIDIINKIDADLVLFPGDVVDEDIRPVIENDLGSLFKMINSKNNIYSITGNHEYIGGVEAACHYLNEHNVNVLRDQTILIDNFLYLVGREDISYNRAERKRKPLEVLLKYVDKNFPIILMDHQPYKLNEAEENGVDMQLSGHTHHGQMFPLNLITKKIYEKSWGYLQKGTTHYYVSCGAGTWGPPIRIGNHPEVIELNLEFD
ncbi:metallophosphoesterase [soil metagenome]